MPTRYTPKSNTRLQVSIPQSQRATTTRRAPPGYSKPQAPVAPKGPRVLEDGTQKPTVAIGSPAPRRTETALSYLKKRYADIKDDPKMTDELRGKWEDAIAKEEEKVNVSKDNYFESLGQMEAKRQAAEAEAKAYKAASAALSKRKLAGG